MDQPTPAPAAPPLPALVLHVNVPVPGTNPPQHFNMPVEAAREMHHNLTAILAQVDAAAPAPARPAPRKNRR